MSTRVLLGSALLILPAVVLGCDVEEADDTDLDAIPGDTAAPLQDTTVAPPVGFDGDQPADTVRATLTEWDIELAADTLQPGGVVFQVHNEGEYDHAFEVEGAGEEWETDVGVGEESTLEVTLEAGTYEVYCPLDDEHGNHEQLGMTTELVVR